MEAPCSNLLHIQDSVTHDPVHAHPLLQDMDSYRKMYNESIKDGNAFWKRMAEELLTWFRPFERVCNVDLSDEDCAIPEDGCVSWFEGGRLNACYNAVDRHVINGRGKKVALLHEANEVGVCRKVTFETLLKCVSQVANALLSMSVRKGEVVTIYMPMIPETVYCMLGCARIGAVANLVFSGFSSSALATRLQSTRSRVLLTADRLNRGNRLVELMPVVKDALLVCPHVEYCVVYQNSDQSMPRDGLEMADQLTCQSHSSALSDLSNSMAGIVQNFHHLIFYDFTEWMAKERMYCPCDWMDSEDPLFVLYTSGSTGKPKGMIHTTGGYLVYASLTHKYLFKVREDDVYACMTDLGWITGHTYVVWGPLLNGTTTCMFESTPLYPNPCRYWDFVQRYKVNVFYTAPTAIRALMKYGESEVSKYDLSTLRVLGTVGEPISPSAWEWYYRVVGKGKCSIVDSYWMTESGGILLAPIPGVTPMKPGSCCLPFFGVKPALIDPNTGDELTSKGVKGVMCVSKPWPSMARGMHGDYKRFVCTYFEPYRRHFFTGDGAYLDKDGYFWITGRLDDVINVSGHRLSTAEIEASLASHGTCTDVAVIGIPHDIKGQSICAFCVPKRGYEFQENLTFELCQHVRRTIASMAMPDKLYLVPALPKTRSGKVMRRLLRKIAAFEFDSLGDISTLAEAEVIDQIISVVRRQGGQK